MKIELKEYEINGVVNYAHCYNFNVLAKTKKEATKIAESRMDSEVIDSSMAEFTDYIMDKPIIIK